MIKGTSEKVVVEFTRYRDEQGLPTCALDFTTINYCKFFRTAKLGTIETCVFAGDYHGVAFALERRCAEVDADPLCKIRNYGSLIPGKFCPLFNQEELP